MEAEEIKRRIERWLRGKGRYDEDLASEMLVFCLEKLKENPELSLNMKIVELRAWDRINPRGWDENGSKVWRDASSLFNRVENVISINGEEISEHTGICQFTATALYKPRRGRMSDRRASALKMRQAMYLARLPFGHLPFVI